MILCTSTVYSLDDHLPERHEATHIYFLSLPRHVQRLPEIADSLFYFRHSADSDFRHSDFVPIEVFWQTYTNGNGLKRTVFLPRDLTVADIQITYENFCGSEYRITINPEASHEQFIASLTTTLQINILPLYQQDYLPIQNLSDFFAEHLQPLPKEQWLTDVDIVYFQAALHRECKQLTPIRACPPEALSTQPAHHSWASATVFRNTRLPLYYAHVLSTLIIGLPHYWNARCCDTLIDSFSSNFPHIQRRPLSSPPEGWCGPLAIASIYYWVGYNQDTQPLQQLIDIHQETLLITNRDILNREARIVAGGKRPFDALRPAPLSAAMLRAAVIQTFYHHTRTTQLYRYTTAEIPHRILHLPRYTLLDIDHFRSFFKAISLLGLPTSFRLYLHPPWLTYHHTVRIILLPRLFHHGNPSQTTLSHQNFCSWILEATCHPICCT